jgi:putative membrane protein
MAEPDTNGPAGQGINRTDLAQVRTRIASERTLMAWIRTAVSLVGFGFSIPKFFQYLEQSGHVERRMGDGPINLGLALVALGTLSLAAGVLQHVLLVRRISPPDRVRSDVGSVSMATAACMVLFGMYAFVNILMRR